MTRKEQILRMIQKLPDNVTYDRVLYHLTVMKGIEIGLQQIERGEVTDHDEFMRELEDKGWLEPELPGRRKPKRRRANPPQRQQRVAHGGAHCRKAN